MICDVVYSTIFWGYCLACNYIAVWAVCVCVPFGWWVEMITEQAAGGSILKSCIYFGERVNAKHGDYCFANWCFVVMWLIWAMTVGD